METVRKLTQFFSYSGSIKNRSSLNDCERSPGQVSNLQDDDNDLKYVENLVENNHVFPAEEDDCSPSFEGECLPHAAKEETDVKLCDGNGSDNIEFAQAIDLSVSTPTKPESEKMTENSASSCGVPLVPYQSNEQSISHSEEEYQYESDDSRHSTNETPFSPSVARKPRSRQNHQNFQRNAPSSKADNHAGTYSNGFRCKLCGDSFETANHYEEHKLTHTTAKLPRSLSCTECGKTFHRRGHLLEHLDIHREPKHSCPNCNKVFVQRSNLKTHMSSCKGSAQKNAKTKASTDEDRSLCSYCPKSFKNARDMYKHVRNFHPEHELLKIPCKLCSKMYYSKPLLIAHMRRFHRSEIKETSESNDQ